MQLVGYVTVRTCKPTEQDQSLEMQVRALASWCRTHGHQLVAILCDKA
jgi:hypothetical protein